MNAFKTWGIIALLAVASSAAASPAAPETTVLDGVVAIVDGQPVLASDIRQEMTILLADATINKAKRPTNAELRDKALDRLVELIITQEVARKKQITVATQEVDQMFANMRKQNSLSEEEFTKRLEAAGLTTTLYRTVLQRQLLYYRVSHAIAGPVAVSDGELEAALKRLPDRPKNITTSQREQFRRQLQEKKISDIAQRWWQSRKRTVDIEKQW